MSTSTQNEQGKSVASMFSRIVPWYDTLNTVLSLGIDRSWRNRLVREVRPGPTGRILDLAAGTLGVSKSLHRRFPEAHIPAMDFCPPMLFQGQKKIKKSAGSAIMPTAADAKKLPLPDECVDAVTMAFGIRNILPRHDAFAEMVRVLVPGGRACILEFGSGKQRIWGGIYNLYLNYLLPGIGKMISHDDNAYTYLSGTIRNFPRAEVLEEEMRDAGFAAAWHIPLTSGIVCLHIGEKARQ